jgi:hypothetical protein
MKTLPLVVWLAGCQAEAPWTASYVHTVVPWVQDTTGAWFLVDTGTPRTQLRPSVLDLPNGEHPAPSWSAAEIVSDTEVVVSDALPSLVLAAEERGEIFGLGGILGADRLAETPVWFDPRAEQLAFVEPPPGTSSVAELAVEVTGGGETRLADGTPVTWDRGRMLVEIEVDSEPMTALVDTASSYLVLTPAAVSRVGGSVETYRTAESDLRLGYASVDVGELVAPEVAYLEAWEELTESLVRLSVEVDRPVEALLGHSLLRTYVTGLDFRRERLELRTYDDGHWKVPTHRVSPGVRVDDDGDCFRVRWVIVGSPAEQAGLELGACVTRVGPWTPVELGADELLDELEAAGAGALFEWEWDGVSTVLESRLW